MVGVGTKSRRWGDPDLGFVVTLSGVGVVTGVDGLHVIEGEVRRISCHHGWCRCGGEGGWAGCDGGGSVGGSPNAFVVHGWWFGWERRVGDWERLSWGLLSQWLL